MSFILPHQQIFNEISIVDNFFLSVHVCQISFFTMKTQIQNNKICPYTLYIHKGIKKNYDCSDVTLIGVLQYFHESIIKQRGFKA